MALPTHTLISRAKQMPLFSVHFLRNGFAKREARGCERLSQIHVFHFTFPSPHARNLAVESSVSPRHSPVAQLIELRLRLGQQIVEF